MAVGRYPHHLPAGSISFLFQSLAHFCCTLDPTESNGLTREDIRLALLDHNIESRPLWKPMHLQPVFKEAPYYGNQVAENLFKTGLCLPSGSNLTDADRDRIARSIRRLIGRQIT
jgi:dTDP-4-amino-4,6-dideoxygalactose transaminase